MNFLKYFEEGNYFEGIMFESQVIICHYSIQLAQILYRLHVRYKNISFTCQKR